MVRLHAPYLLYIFNRNPKHFRIPLQYLLRQLREHLRFKVAFDLPLPEAGGLGEAGEVEAVAVHIIKER